jgi:hypothetical protein
LEAVVVVQELDDREILATGEQEFKYHQCSKIQYLNLEQMEVVWDTQVLVVIIGLQVAEVDMVVLVLGPRQKVVDQVVLMLVLVMVEDLSQLLMLLLVQKKIVDLVVEEEMVLLHHFAEVPVVPESFSLPILHKIAK